MMLDPLFYFVTLFVSKQPNVQTCSYRKNVASSFIQALNLYVGFIEQKKLVHLIVKKVMTTM